jgi:hypothetical protein
LPVFASVPGGYERQLRWGRCWGRYWGGAWRWRGGGIGGGVGGRQQASTNEHARQVRAVRCVQSAMRMCHVCRGCDSYRTLGTWSAFRARRYLCAFSRMPSPCHLTPPPPPLRLYLLCTPSPACSQQHWSQQRQLQIQDRLVDSRSFGRRWHCRRDRQGVEWRGRGSGMNAPYKRTAARQTSAGGWGAVHAHAGANAAYNGRQPDVAAPGTGHASRFTAPKQL